MIQIICCTFWKKPNQTIFWTSNLTYIAFDILFIFSAKYSVTPVFMLTLGGPH